MKKSRLTIIILLAIACNACAFHYQRNTTIGQEILSLHEAMKNNALSDTEFAHLKEKIIEKGIFSLEHD